MIEVNNVFVSGFNHAVRGMRNPLESWAKSDTKTVMCGNDCDTCPYKQTTARCCAAADSMGVIAIVGANDLELMHKLYNGGSEHRKYMRQINVSMDITAPQYWWSEFDTYKIGTTANSTSKMHKIHAKPITVESFSFSDLTANADEIKAVRNWVKMLEGLRKEYVLSKNKGAWECLIRLLPMAYLQTRTVTFNYEVAANIIKQRRGHKLHEWRTFIDALSELPYLMDIAEG